MIDTSANLSNYVAQNASNLSTKLHSMAVSDGVNPLQISSSLLSVQNGQIINSPLLDFLSLNMSGSYSFQLTSMLAANISSILAPAPSAQLSKSFLSHISAFSVTNSASNLSSSMSMLMSLTNANKIGAISCVPSPDTLAMTGSDVLRC